MKEKKNVEAQQSHLQDIIKFMYQAWNQVCVNLSPNCQQSAINYQKDQRNHF